MYEFSYNEIIEDSPRFLREQEHAAFNTLIELMKRAQSKDTTSKDVIESIFYIRSLWTIIINDVGNPNNTLPNELKQALTSIGVWVMKEASSVTRTGKADFSTLIEINEIIRDGLV